MKVFMFFICAFMCAGLQAKTFLNPPEVIQAGSKDYQGVDTRQFQGISSLAVSDSGRLWATWYGGPTPGEDKNNYVILSTSGDGGKSWREKFIVDPDGAGDIRAFDPEIWLDPDGRLWLFWAQHPASDRLNPHSGVWAMRNDNPDREAGKWSSPRRLTEGIMMCKPTVLSGGKWLFPASTWRNTDYSARAVASDNNGLSFEVAGACNVLPVEERAFDEHMFVERTDGSIWMLVRTKYGIGESFSRDKGATWSEFKPSAIKHPSARFFIRRLNSGNLLLVKHGPIDEQTGRSHLMAFISKDDGKTWLGGLLLDERVGVSYPDGQQTADGTIYITYDYSRTGEKKIHMATFTEEDALAGKARSGKVRQRVIISEGTPAESDKNQDGKPLAKKPAAAISGGQDSFRLDKGAKLFSDRSYQATKIPEALEGAQCLRVNMDGNKSVQCRKSGMVYFLTPKPNRNKDSQAEHLEKQGFERVALPEMPLFNQKPTSFCTLYQKKCKQGEQIRFGKWAVPVLLNQ